LNSVPTGLVELSIPRGINGRGTESEFAGPMRHMDMSPHSAARAVACGRRVDLLPLRTYRHRI